MSVPPELFAIGKDYLNDMGIVARVQAILSGNRVSYAYRKIAAPSPFVWTGATANIECLVYSAIREVPVTGFQRYQRAVDEVKPALNARRRLCLP